MALQVSSSQIRDIVTRAQSAIRKAESVKEKSEAAINTAVDALVTSGTAFGLGVMRGRQGGRWTPFGVPFDLALGVGAHLAGFTGVVGKATPHVHSIGNGALAAFAYSAGQDAGKSWKSKSGGKSISDTLGGIAKAIEETGGGGLSDEALAKLARRA